MDNTMDRREFLGTVAAASVVFSPVSSAIVLPGGASVPSLRVLRVANIL